MKHLLSTLALVSVAILMSTNSFAQDAVKADPKHYKVEFENDRVRVLRITYGPGEKSVRHEHPDAVAVFVSDFQAKFSFPDGKSEDRTAKAGQVLWTPATKHLPENTGSRPFEVILVELKSIKK